MVWKVEITAVIYVNKRYSKLMDEQVQKKILSQQENAVSRRK